MAEFLSGDDAVLAVMAAAVDVVAAAGLTVDDDDDPSAHLQRALHWHRYSRGPVNRLHRRCGGRHLPRIVEASAAGGRPVTDVDHAGDPIGAVDALVAGVDPGLSSPGVESRDVVLVTGPWLSGATGLIAALRERLPEHEFVEAEEIRPADAPAAVVFVVSAVAPIAESDCAFIDLAARHTDLVVGAVSKIDVHRNWRDVMAEDKTRLAAHSERYRDVPWVGVAAAPDLGEPNIDELVDLLRSRLDDVDMRRRNRLRAWESRLQTVISRYDKDGAGADRQARVTALRAAGIPFCVSAECPSPSEPSHCAARFSRPKCSWRISRVTAAPRCEPSCRRTRRR